jgi:hypothetical protein
MLDPKDYKPLQSKADQPVSSQDWAVRLTQLLTEITETLDPELKQALGNYRNAIAIASNDIIKKALASQRRAIGVHLDSLGQHDAARCINAE